MSFLNQLKKQAKSLQTQRTEQDSILEDRAAQTESACQAVLQYFQDLGRQLSVIEPDGPHFSLDNRTPWPPVKLVEFRVDARRKQLRDREVFDYIAMGWRVVPQPGQKTAGVVSVNFPTDMQRVEARLMMGPVKHERLEIRHAESSVLREVRYEHETSTRGSVMVKIDHEQAQLEFRLLNTTGFDVSHCSVPVERVDEDLLDELAKRIVGQPNRFL